MLANVPQFPTTMRRVLKAGHNCVNVNPLYTVRELEHQLSDSCGTAIVCWRRPKIDPRRVKAQSAPTGASLLRKRGLKALWRDLAGVSRIA